MRYEDLVDNPTPTLSRLYKYLQIPFTQEIEDYLFKMTHATEKWVEKSQFTCHFFIQEFQISMGCPKQNETGFLLNSSGHKEANYSLRISYEKFNPYLNL